MERGFAPAECPRRVRIVTPDSDGRTVPYDGTGADWLTWQPTRRAGTTDGHAEPVPPTVRATPELSRGARGA